PFLAPPSLCGVFVPEESATIPGKVPTRAPSMLTNGPLSVIVAALSSEKHAMLQHRIRQNTDLVTAAAEAEARYTAANPKSAERHRRAAESMPGGNTRTVLHYSPFPLTIVSGEGCYLRDLDGHDYTDFLGEYTAGLYGHSNQIIQAAMRKVVDH